LAEGRFLFGHRAVRDAIIEDSLYLGLPATLVFTSGLVICAGDGWVTLPVTVWNLIKQPRSVAALDWIIPYDGNGTDVPPVRAWAEAPWRYLNPGLANCQSIVWQLSVTLAMIDG
jgi:hypothetical protein